LSEARYFSGAKRRSADCDLLIRVVSQPWLFAAIWAAINRNRSRNGFTVRI
jgi:hypothetical protein